MAPKVEEVQVASPHLEVLEQVAVTPLVQTVLWGTVVGVVVGHRHLRAVTDVQVFW